MRSTLRARQLNRECFKLIFLAFVCLFVCLYPFFCSCVINLFSLLFCARVPGSRVLKLGEQERDYLFYNTYFFIFLLLIVFFFCRCSVLFFLSNQVVINNVLSACRYKDRSTHLSFLSTKV